ncbi:uncharacterized protein LOC107272978 [Cephus cinctus]|uniref:Uncharacterized protein LOC107272978 n=1 Tax=Cephus cinctus TaxID=211228 RepID=A0AAJ7CB66_CEPCN|nr:uncharacterized protein LOC107272978 [Cephus cinctus]XP_015606207.1 uncharacterized protein LOC107272978 [Cephus cinctus]
MLEEMTNSWAPKFHSLLDLTLFLPFAPNFQNNLQIEEKKIADLDIFVGYLILLWAMLYMLYEKCLNVLLRSMRFPLMQRSRIIDAVWSCGFCFGSISFLKFSAMITPELSSLQLEEGRLELGLILHKSFYLHHAGIKIFCRGSWLKGWTDLLFALLIINSHQHKWCPIIINILFYKTINTLLVEICRISLSLWQTKFGKLVTKTLFLCYCLNWIYVYTCFVPDSLRENNNIPLQLYLWMWYISECLNSVWVKLLGNFNSSHWLEACLFLPPTPEALELARIRKRHRDSLKNNRSSTKTPKKIEFWRTLLCAIAMKKKIRRMRQAKQNKTQTETANNEEEIKEITSE